MKKIIFFLFIIAVSSCGPKQMYLDEHGKEISKRDFWNLWDNHVNPITSWDFITEDKVRVAQIVKPVYSPLVVRYPVVKERLEEITGREFEDKIFLIIYNYLNDLCSGNGTRLNKLKIANLKYRINPEKTDIESRNKDIIILEFFENGFILENSPDSPEEYFFIDKDNFLRNSLFRTRASCGSFALIKPNGAALIKNGEDNLLRIEQLLKPENWNQLFTE